MSSSLCDTIWLSEKRKNLLLLLMEGPRDIEQIKTSLNVNSKAMMPQIKILKKAGIDSPERGRLRTFGDRKTCCREYASPAEYTGGYRRKQGILGKPGYECDTSRDMFMRLGELGECMVIEPDLNHLFDLPREFTENLTKSRCILSSLSYYHPLYPSLYSKLAKSEAEVELVLTESVFERLKNESPDELRSLLNSENTICSGL